MPKTKTVELPVTVVRWLASLAEDGLYAPLSKEGSNLPTEERNKREALIDTVSDACEEGKAPSFSIAAKDMAGWEETRASGLTWAQLCGIEQTLVTCRGDARLGPGGLRDLDTLEGLARRAAGES